MAWCHCLSLSATPSSSPVPPPSSLPVTCSLPAGRLLPGQLSSAPCLPIHPASGEEEEGRRRRARRAPQRPRRCCQHGAAPGKGRCSPAAQGAHTSGGLCRTTQTGATAQPATPPPPALPCRAAPLPHSPRSPTAPPQHKHAQAERAPKRTPTSGRPFPVRPGCASPSATSQALRSWE